jgi:hypothetical protein
MSSASAACYFVLIRAGTEEFTTEQDREVGTLLGIEIEGARIRPEIIGRP